MYPTDGNGGEYRMFWRTNPKDFPGSNSKEPKEGLCVDCGRAYDPAVDSASDRRGNFAYSITFTLHHIDLNALKAEPLVATNLSNSYIRVSAEVIDDSYGRDVQAITDGQAEQADLDIRLVLPVRTDPSGNLLQARDGCA